MLPPRVVFAALWLGVGALLGVLAARRVLPEPVRALPRLAALVPGLLLLTPWPELHLLALAAGLILSAFARGAQDRVISALAVAAALVVLLLGSPTHLAGSDVHYHVRATRVNLDDEGTYTPGAIDHFDAWLVAMADALGLLPSDVLVIAVGALVASLLWSRPATFAFLALAPLTLYQIANFVHFTFVFVALIIIMPPPDERAAPWRLVFGFVLAAVAHPLAGVMVGLAAAAMMLRPTMRSLAVILGGLALLLVTWSFARDSSLLLVAVSHLRSIVGGLGDLAAAGGIAGGDWTEWGFEAWLAFGVLFGPGLILGAWASDHARRLRADPGIGFLGIGIVGSGLGVGLLLPQRWLAVGPAAVRYAPSLRLPLGLVVVIALGAAFSPFVNVGFAHAAPGAGADLVPSTEEIAANAFAADLQADDVWWTLSNVDARRAFQAANYADLDRMPTLLANATGSAVAIAAYPAADARVFREAGGDAVGAAIGAYSAQELTTIRAGFHRVSCVYSSGAVDVCVADRVARAES